MQVVLMVKRCRDRKFKVDLFMISEKDTPLEILHITSQLL